MDGTKALQTCILAVALAAGAVARAGAGCGAAHPHRVRLVRAPDQAPADLGRRARLPAGAVRLPRRQRLWRRHLGRPDRAARGVRQSRDHRGLRESARDGAGARHLGRPRLRQERRRRPNFPFKAATKQLFLDFWQVPGDDPRRTRPGIYHAETFGPEGMRVQVILDTLKTRSTGSSRSRRSEATSCLVDRVQQVVERGRVAQNRSPVRGSHARSSPRCAPERAAPRTHDRRDPRRPASRRAWVRPTASATRRRRTRSRGGAVIASSRGS